MIVTWKNKVFSIEVDFSKQTMDIFCDDEYIIIQIHEEPLTCYVSVNKDGEIRRNVNALIERSFNTIKIIPQIGGKK